MTEQTTPKAFTAAQLKLNHERTAKAVAKLNEKSFNGIRYTAILEEGKTGVIVEEVRPYGEKDFKETVRITTGIDQVIGQVINYSNRYTDKNHGSMCQAIYRASENRSNRLDGLRALENKADKLRAELAAAEAAVARRREELGL